MSGPFTRGVAVAAFVAFWLAAGVVAGAWLTAGPDDPGGDVAGP